MPFKVGWLFLIVCWLTQSYIYAGIRIEPEVIKINAAAGTMCSRQLQVENSDTFTAYFQIEPEYWVGPKGLRIQAPWFTFAPASLMVPANGKNKIQIDLIIPPSLQGESVIMIFFAQAATGSGIFIQPRYGIPLYLNRRGTEAFKGSVERLTVEQAADEKKPVFCFTLKNSGNIHFIPVGFVRYKKAGSSESRELALKAMEPIMAGEEKLYRLELSQPLDSGKYSAELNVLLTCLYDDIDKRLLPVINRKLQWLQP